MDKKVALQIRSYEPWKETAKAMSEVGFQYVSMVFGEEKMLGDDWKKNVDEMGETFAKYNLKCIQTHAPYYDLLISAEHRDADMEKCCSALWKRRRCWARKYAPCIREVISSTARREKRRWIGKSLWKKT